MVGPVIDNSAMIENIFKVNACTYTLCGYRYYQIIITLMIMYCYAILKIAINNIYNMHNLSCNLSSQYCCDAATPFMHNDKTIVITEVMSMKARTKKDIMD